jgi:Retrotransposon gag protein/Zinc knuckle
VYISTARTMSKLPLVPVPAKLERYKSTAERTAMATAAAQRTATARASEAPAVDEDEDDVEDDIARAHSGDLVTTGQMAEQIREMKQLIEAMTAKATEDARLLQQAEIRAASNSGAAPKSPQAGSVAHRSQVQSASAAAAGALRPPTASSMRGVGGYPSSLAHLQQAEVNPLEQHAKRIRPSELLGKEAAKGSVLEDWLFQVERAIGDDEQYTLSHILKFARFYWDRSVNTWWTGYTEMQNAKGTPVSSWDEVKAAFRANYTAMSDEQTACDQLFGISMKSTETMDEYVARVSELYNRIPRARVTTEAAAEHMQRGVKPSRFPLAMVDVTTRQQRGRAANAGRGLSFEVMRGVLIEAAVREPTHLIESAATAAAAAANAQRQRQGGQSERKTKIGQLSTRGRYPLPEQEDDGWVEDGDDDESRHSVNAMDLKCYRCNGTGHLARDCKKPEKRTCYICKAVGHLANGCPKKKDTGTGGGTGKPKNE